MSNILFKYFAKRIIVDVSPSQFIFTRADKDLNFSFPTFVYLNNNDSKSSLLSVGEELPSEQRNTSGVVRIDVFDLDNPLPQNTTYNRDGLVEILFEFGLGRCFEMSALPPLRPVVFILGVDRFSNLFKNPKDIFEKTAKQGGAGIVIFDKTEVN